MAARRIVAIAARAQVLQRQNNDDNAVQRALDSLAEEAARSRKSLRSAKVVNLAVGDNRIQHGLGVAPIGCTVTPTVADATFAWALTSKDARTAVITVAGVAQPGAAVEFFA